MISAIVGVAIIVTAAFALVYSRFQDFLVHPLEIPADGTLVLVESGESLTAVLRKLERRGVTTVDWRWKLLLRRQSVNVQVGEYQLLPPMNPPELLEKFDSGEVLQHRFTIVEGWNWSQLLEALKSNQVILQTIEGSIDASEIEAIATDIGAPDIEHAEGWFLPETYYFVRGERDIDILQRAHQAMKAALGEAWKGRNTGLPLETPEELLILASIVEKETSLPQERELIAGVLTRRLNKGMRLQTDPTVIYGMGASFDGNIRRKDLRADNPYNTYTRKGLPPTPIAMPGRQTLIAAANPSDGTALYFVADGKGGHTFSATLEEHEAAVKELIERK
jgi:UPF0755 protein